MKKLLLIILLCISSNSFMMAQSKTGFGKTWVFIVGVLEWKDSNSFASFEKKDRLDNKILKFFRENGIPENQIAYISDKQATTKAVKDAFIPFSKQAQKDDMLFFYYCGHGYKNDKKQVCFANYQGSDWSAEEIVKTVNENFAGNTAFFTADCCNSGGLSLEVQKYKTKNFVALNSVVPKDVSTGNWTFSNALLYGLQGQPFVDTDNDGAITLNELANYIDQEMAIVEGQKSANYIPANMKNWVVASNVSKKKSARIGERVLVNYEGQDWLGFITSVNKDGLFKVRFYSYTNDETDWVESSRIKPFTCKKNFAVGASVKVYYKDDQKWYPATVVKKFSCLHYIHYEGFGKEWDEWVSPDNIKL